MDDASTQRTVTTERMKRAEARLDEALNALETPFQLATIVTACWRYSIGDDDGAAYGLTEHGLELWQLIERVVKFERAKTEYARAEAISDDRRTVA
jgi:hypothetical protein